jgi:hypothetical protein
MSPVLVVSFIREQPPCDAQAVPWRQCAEDAELYEVTDVTHIAVLHGLVSGISWLS